MYMLPLQKKSYRIAKYEVEKHKANSSQTGIQLFQFHNGLPSIVAIVVPIYNRYPLFFVLTILKT